MENTAVEMDWVRSDAATMAFLDVVADTGGITGAAACIQEQHVCRRDVLLHGKTAKYKGIDYTNPAVIDIGADSALQGAHKPYYGMMRGTALADTVVDCVTADDTCKVLFFPNLMEPHYPVARSTRYDDNQKKMVVVSKYRGYSNDDVAAVRAIWVDVDGHGIPPDQTAAAMAAMPGLIDDACALQGIPPPTLVCSGLGVHLYWWFTPVDVRQDAAAVTIWQRLQAKANAWVAGLIANNAATACWSVDPAAAPIGHAMNIPGTIHPHTGALRTVLAVRPATTMQCLVAAFGVPATAPELPVQPSFPAKEKKEETTKQKPIYVDTPALHCLVAGNRCSRLLVWLADHNYDIVGRRNVYLMIYGIVYCTAKGVLDDGQQGTLRAELLRVNDMLQPGLPAGDVDKIADNIANQGWHAIKNSTIADRLGMTQQEIAWFSPPGGTQGVIAYGRKAAWDAVQATGIDYRRRNKTRDDARAKRKVSKAAAYEQIPILRAKGQTQKDIAAQLRISIATVKRHWMD